MINEEIRAKEIRVVDSDGSQLGIMSSKDAQKIASQKELDLVMIAPQANPPVCKIMDFGKYIFELNKKEKEAKKKQKVVNVKEIRLSPTIEEHDIQVKVKHIIEFLKDGDKVKISVRFKGRQLNHVTLGKTLLEKFVEFIGDAGAIEKEPKLEGKSMIMVVSPK